MEEGSLRLTTGRSLATILASIGFVMLVLSNRFRFQAVRALAS